MIALALSSLVLYAVGVVAVVVGYVRLPHELRPPTGWPGAALLALLWPCGALALAIDFFAGCVLRGDDE